MTVGNPGRPRRPKTAGAVERSPAEHAAQAVGLGLAVLQRSLPSGAVAGDDRAASEQRSALRLTAITRPCAERARGRDQAPGLTSAPSTSQRPPIRTGGKIPGSA